MTDSKTRDHGSSPSRNGWLSGRQPSVAEREIGGQYALAVSHGSAEAGSAVANAEPCIIQAGAYVSLLVVLESAPVFLRIAREAKRGSDCVAQLLTSAHEIVIVVSTSADPCDPHNARAR